MSSHSWGNRAQEQRSSWQGASCPTLGCLGCCEWILRPRPPIKVCRTTARVTLLTLQQRWGKWWRPEWPRGNSRVRPGFWPLHTLSSLLPPSPHLCVVTSSQRMTTCPLSECGIGWDGGEARICRELGDGQSGVWPALRLGIGPLQLATWTSRLCPCCHVPRMARCTHDVSCSGLCPGLTKRRSLGGRAVVHGHLLVLPVPSGHKLVPLPRGGALWGKETKSKGESSRRQMLLPPGSPPRCTEDSPLCPHLLDLPSPQQHI